MYFYVIYFYDGDNIQKDDLQKQIEALRGEVRALSESFVSLRQEDLREVMGEQIRSVLLERIDRFVLEAVKEGMLAVPDRDRCRDDLNAFVNEVIMVFQRDGKASSLRYLEERKDSILGQGRSRQNAGYAKFVTDLVLQLRSYFDLSDRIFRPIRPTVEEADQPLSPVVGRPLSPTLVEETLGPLSNSWRINILMLLSKESSSLAELSKALGLKKGHLQFHLKALVDPGYVRYDRKGHLYFITERGSVALEGLAKLVDSLATA